MLLSRIFLLSACFIALLSVNARAQLDVDVQSLTLTNPPATSCTNTFVTASGMLSAASYIFNGAITAVNGNNITVNLEYQAGIIILPAFMPFSHDIDLGMLAPGTYNVTVTGSLNGVQQASSGMLSVTVTSCCPVTASIQASDTNICLGESATFINTSTGATQNE